MLSCTRFPSVSALALGAVLAFGACLPSEGGANDNQKAPGDDHGGVQVGLGDIAVAPTGGYVLFRGGDSLAVGWPETGAVVPLPVRRPTRLAFSKQRPVVYVGSDEDLAVHAIDVVARAELWAAPVGAAQSTSAMRIAATKNDARVVVAIGDRVWLVDAKTGKAVTPALGGRSIVDLAILPDDDRALVVHAHVWTKGAPSTRVSVVRVGSGATNTFDVPNCSDRIAVTPGGSRAFLAPTTCQRDPVSVIDLEPGHETWTRNLPGFGPVAMAPDGSTAVAFLDAQNADAALFDDASQIPSKASGQPRYHLMILDTDALAFDLVAVGDTLPRFALTPDGGVLLVDSSWGGKTAPVRLLDAKTRAFRDVSGPGIRLDNFALTSDSRHAYAIDSGLYGLDIPAAKSAAVSVGFAPTNVNIAPDDATLYLRKDARSVCVFSVAPGACRATLTATAER